MAVAPLAPFPWKILSPHYLNAFASHTSRGTLVAPRTQDRYLKGERMIVADGQRARDLEVSSLSVLNEVQIYWGSLMEPERRIPYLLPAMNGWHMDRFEPGALVFGKAHRRVEIDCREFLVPRYAFGLTASHAEIRQGISIDMCDDTVSTDFYRLRKRFDDLVKAVEFAWLASVAVYSSRMYSEKELGPLLFRPNEMADEKEIGHRQPPPAEIADVYASKEILFASARSLFGTRLDGCRNPVVASKVTPAPRGSYDVTLSLHRPPRSPCPLMPLPIRLHIALWEPIRALILR